MAEWAEWSHTPPTLESMPYFCPSSKERFALGVCQHKGRDGWYIQPPTSNSWENIDQHIGPFLTKEAAMLAAEILFL